MIRIETENGRYVQLRREDFERSFGEKVSCLGCGKTDNITLYRDESVFCHSCSTDYWNAKMRNEQLTPWTWTIPTTGQDVTPRDRRAPATVFWVAKPRKQAGYSAHFTIEQDEKDKKP